MGHPLIAPRFAAARLNAARFLSSLSIREGTLETEQVTVQGICCQDGHSFVASASFGMNPALYHLLFVCGISPFFVTLNSDFICGYGLNRR